MIRDLLLVGLLAAAALAQTVAFPGPGLGSSGASASVPWTANQLTSGSAVSICQVTSRFRLAQSFIPDVDIRLDQIKVKAFHTNSPGWHLILKVYADDGSTTKPGATVLATATDSYALADIPATTVGTANILPYNIAGGVPLTAGTKYWFAVQRAEGDALDGSGYFNVTGSSAGVISGVGESAYAITGPAWGAEVASDLYYQLTGVTR
jgi:hypothetical protein